MTTWEVIMWVAIAMLGLAGSALCNGIETGVYSLNRVRLSIRASDEPGEGGVWAGSTWAARRLQRELERPGRVLATLLIGTTIFSDCGSIAISALLEHSVSSGMVVVLNVAILTPLLFVFADAIPKELFRVEADRLTYRAAPFLTVSRLVLTVALLVPLIEWLARLLTRWLRLEEGQTLGGQRQAMAALLQEGARHGVLSESQVSLLDRAMLLRETTIRGEMVPWSRVHAVSAAWDRARVAEFLAAHAHSRYPLVDAHGNVVGVVEHLDLCVYPERSPSQLAHPVVFLSPDSPVRDGLVQLRTAQAKLGVVRQAGRPIGVVATADLIEPLTGPEPEESVQGKRNA